MDARLLEWLRHELYEKFRVPTEILGPALDPSFARHAERQQYHSSEILARMQKYVNGRHLAPGRNHGIGSLHSDFDVRFWRSPAWRASAVVSYHRLRQEFYGLPPDAEVLANRLLIEAVHELGHTLRLTHCHDYRCAMAAAHAVEWIDIKDSGFCEDCLARALQAV